MRKTLTILTLLTAALAKPALAQAADSAPAVDDLDLVKLLNVSVSTATKTAESVDEAPAVITVVTKEDIHRFGYRNMGEVLSHCVGFYSVDDHVQPNVAVRGMTGGLGAQSSVIKIMIDGRSVADRTTSGNWLGAELIPLESVRQIEIIRGPASALYGADAFLGVVNIITESPDESRPVRARLFFGVTGKNMSEQLDVVGNARIGRFDFLLGAIGERGSRSGLELPVESPSPNLPEYVGERRTANNLDRTSLGLQARVGYRVPDVGHVIGSAYLSGFSRGGDFAPWAQLTNGTDPEGRKLGTVISEGQLRLNLDTLYHAHKMVDLALQGTYSQRRFLPGDRIEFGSDLWYARRRTSYRSGDAVAELRFFPTKRFNAIVGVEGVLDRESLRAPRQIVRETEEAVAVGGASANRVTLSNVGAFVSTNVVVIERWLKLTGGLRFDHHSEYGNQLTGRVGATSRLSDSLVLKLLYGSAFKAPSPYLLYASPMGPGDVLGNPALRPQKIHTVESQLSFKPNPFIALTSGVSYNWLLDKAEFTPQGINQVAQNMASQKTFTWETRADVHHYDDYSAYLGWEMVRSRRGLGEVGYASNLVGDANIVYPNYVARAGGAVSIPSPVDVPLSAGAEGMFVGPRHAADASVLANGAQFDLDPYVTMNVFVTTRNLYLIPGHESVVALRAYNILGERGPDPGFSGFEYPLTQREVFLEFRHTY